MIIETSCKLCKQPISAPCPDETPPEWLNAFTPMLTCNACFDRRQKFKRATDAILNYCWTLRRAREFAPERLETLTPLVEKTLRAATLMYAKVMAEYRNLSVYVWDEDFVRQLMQKPEDAFIILRKYRAMLKTHFQPAQIMRYNEQLKDL